MKITIVAGESSGDFLAANLIDALHREQKGISIQGIAGPKMLAAGCKALFPMDSLAVMGLWEVLKHLPSLLKLRRQFLQQLLKDPPDIYIGVDAPDFNLPIELRLRQAGIRTVHYHSPSVWAWRPKRIHKIAKAVDLMLTLFPFETEIYHQHHIPVHYVGHPLADDIPLETDILVARKQLNLPEEKKIVALLPGSRIGEINQLAEPFLQTAQSCLEKQPDLVFVMPLVNSRCRAQLEAIKQRIAPTLPITFFDNQSHGVMAAADVVLLASGTATLEAMLLKRPMVVAYRVATLTYWMAKQLVNTRYFSLPNLLANKELVPEFIQDAATPASLAAAVLERINNPDSLNALKTEYMALHQQLRMDGSAKAAKAILEIMT